MQQQQVRCVIEMESLLRGTELLYRRQCNITSTEVVPWFMRLDTDL